jgi:hypothetical protein
MTTDAELIAILLNACEVAFEALKHEWLYQTGQFSRIADPPSNYPPQGTVSGKAGDAMPVLRVAIDLAKGK